MLCWFSLDRLPSAYTTQGIRSNSRRDVDFILLWGGADAAFLSRNRDKLARGAWRAFAAPSGPDYSQACYSLAEARGSSCAIVGGRKEARQTEPAFTRVLQYAIKYRPKVIGHAPGPPESPKMPTSLPWTHPAFFLSALLSKMSRNGQKSRSAAQEGGAAKFLALVLLICRLLLLRIVIGRRRAQ